ncbi:MAG: tRNA lysidine(34) synthetase TilS [Treponema sp.]|nr:tRNA lysidine(34) synthetase TilS [Treponema sp.]
MDFENTIAAVIQHCPPGTALLAAVSGGADSTAMLAALAALKGRGADFSLRCIHVEHGIRPAAESRGDAEFVQSLCQKLSVPCRVISVAPGAIAAAARKRGIGIEASARLYRRRAWFREARRLESEGPVRVLTAHTADDMLETALMRILRGSGPCGLAAMPVSRGRLLRPLLTLSRRDVLAYLGEKGFSWREDSTNTDTQFLRNRIRRRLVPHLNEYFPQWRAALASLAETQSLTAEFISTEASRNIQWQPSPVPHSLCADAETFFAQPAIIREEALFQGINKLGISGKIKRANIRRFAQGKAAAADLGFAQLRKNAQQVTISIKPHKDDLESFPSSLFPVPRSPFPSPYSPVPSPQPPVPSPQSPVPQSPSPHSEYGFSLLINTPGSYNLKGIEIKASECPDGSNAEDGSFLALLPLVLRPCYSDDAIGQDCGKIAPKGVFAAVDALGLAAFVACNGLGRSRDDTAALKAASGHCVVRITVRGV